MPRQRLSLLVVDDDGEDVEILEDVLAGMRGYEASVTWASSYEQAMRADHDAFDAILVDYKLGAHSGLDLLRFLAGLRVKAPVILLTGLDDPVVDAEASASGAADFLVKGGFDAASLERSFRYALAWGRLVDELRRKEADQRLLIDASFDGIVVHDGAGVVIQANETAERLVGRRLARGETLEVLPLSAILEAMVGGDSTGRPRSAGVTGTWDLRRADGGTVPVEWQCKPIWQEGRSALLTSLRDVTERRRMQERLLERERLVTAGLLASSLAHEIGTPLAVMRGRAEMLEVRLRNLAVADSSVHKSLSVVVEQIDRVTRLIRTLLSYMRGEADSQPAAVSLREALDEACDLVSGELRGKGVELVVDVPVSARVRAEPDGLRQVFVNLLVNAMHAIEAGAVADPGRPRAIRVEATLREEGAWDLAVRDTGCGIRRADFDAIFVPFFTTKDRGKGTGLGLAIVQQALVKWGGGIEVESTEGEGTSFLLRFTAAESY